MEVELELKLNLQRVAARMELRERAARDDAPFDAPDEGDADLREEGDSAYNKNFEYTGDGISFKHFEYTGEDAEHIIYTLSLTSLGVRASASVSDLVHNVATWFPVRRVRGLSDTRWDPHGDD